jgi:hypothetical protein
MTAQDWAALLIAIVTVMGGLAATTRWMVKNYLQELRPNSGSSLRDKVDVNTERLSRVEHRVDQIYLILSEK